MIQECPSSVVGDKQPVVWQRLSPLRVDPLAIYTHATTKGDELAAAVLDFG